MITKEQEAFNAGFDAGYEKGQSDAGEGGCWLTPPDEKVAWTRYKKTKVKPKKTKKKDFSDLF